MQKTQTEVYETQRGKAPFIIWLRSLKDIRGRAIIRTRINRIRTGNLGERRNVGDGVWELKINFGPGYRVYYGQDTDKIIFLIGGDKGSQKNDIKEAKECWQDFKIRKGSTKQDL